MPHATVAKLPGLLIAFALLSALAVAQEQGKPDQAHKPAAAKQDQTVSDKSAHHPADYVGAEACQTCHEDMYKNWEKTPHWKTTYNSHDGPEKQGCEACHGPGQAHVDSGGDKTKIFAFKGVPAAKISERCLGRHTYGEEHSNFARSAHNQNNVSCIGCHSPHNAREAQFLLTKSQPQLCYTCHL